MRADTKMPAYFPTHEQELLLKASLLDAEQAELAWRKWQELGDLDNVDPGSHRLLPLLHTNLVKHQIDYVHMDRVKGVKRLTFYRNQLLIHNVSEVLRLLHNAEIPFVLLKGAGLIAQGAYQVNERTMSDLDVLVPFDKVQASVQLLEGAGWSPESPFLGKAISFSHASPFRNDSGLALDLHWHVISHSQSSEIDKIFWRYSSESELIGEPARVLDATSQLVHICVHGARFSTTPSIRWVADSVRLSRLKNTAFDWSRLIDIAARYSLSLPLRDTLGYLQDNFHFPVNTQTIDALKSIPVSKGQLREYRSVANRNDAFDNLISYWYGFLKTRPSPISIRAVFDFPEYLRVAWKKASIWQVIWHILRWPLLYLEPRLKSWLLSTPILGTIFKAFRNARSKYDATKK